MTQIVFTRTLVGDGSLGTLTVPAAPGGPFWLGEDIAVPELEHRTTFADTSAHVAGTLATQAVQAVGALGMTIYTEADTEADLAANMKALRAVLSQFTYTATLTLVGTDAYEAMPARLSWGVIDSGHVKRLLVPGAVTIPVQPLEA
jgi:hypothetical protein